MIEGEDPDPEANYAYYALLKFHILPSVFAQMDEKEKAFVIASINIKSKHDKEREKKAKQAAKRKR